MSHSTLSESRNVMMEEHAMNLDVVRPIETEERMRELLAKRNDAEGQARFLEELRRTVTAYEIHYDMPSERIHEAIESGELVEDREVGHWIFQYKLLRRVEAE